MTIGRGMSTQMATSTSTMSTTVPTDYFSPGTDWNDCCYYVKSFGILFPRYGNSVEDDPDNSYGSPDNDWIARDDYVLYVDLDGSLGDVYDVERSYGSPNTYYSSGSGAGCVRSDGVVLSIGHIVTYSYGR